MVFNNPCGDQQWVADDNFEVYDLPFGVKFDTSTTPFVSRSLTVAPDASIVVDQPFDFTYSRAHQYGEGKIQITDPDPLSVSATASPARIAAGGTSQLNAIPTGGVPPYSYSWWFFTDSLSNTEIQNPIASPHIDTSYTVEVSDSHGLKARASVTVIVGLSAIITATSTTINPGQTSFLAAYAIGGTPPYNYLWLPKAGLIGDASSPGIDVRPTVTTTYTVRVTDSAGVQSDINITVTVNPAAPPMTLNVTANPAALALVGQSSQLDVAVSGGTAPYTYAWIPASTLNFANIRNPVATPTTRSPTIDTVTVTDATGATATGRVLVTFLILQ